MVAKFLSVDESLKQIPQANERVIIHHTAKDILTRDPTAYEIQAGIEEEAAFRRGYFFGVDDTIEAVREGVSLRRLITYFNGKLWEWRFQGDYSKIIEPPKMPRSMK